MRVVVVSFAALALAVAPARTAAVAPGAVEVLHAVAALPAHIAGRFEDPIGFVRARTGESVVLDRRAHAVYTIDATQTAARRVLQVGFEQGRIVGPGVLAMSRDDIFAVADAPNGLERIQYFDLDGLLLGGFYTQARIARHVMADGRVLNGVGSMSFTGRTFLVSRPDAGALFSELDNRGVALRQIGTLRPTSQESDRDVHEALNAGWPIADPAGGYYFVFAAGVPMFRKYDAAGTLLFERHIEGPELDVEIQRLPASWPRRPDGGAPVMEPLVRATAVDAGGGLWISLAPGVTYVYDRHGEKTRTVQFKGATVVAPLSLFFAGDRLLVTPGCYEFAWR